MECWGEINGEFQEYVEARPRARITHESGESGEIVRVAPKVSWVGLVPDWEATGRPDLTAWDSYGELRV